MAFQHETGNWVNYRTRFRLLPDDEIDLHFGLRDTREKSYAEVMHDVRNMVVERLQRAQTKFPALRYVHARVVNIEARRHHCEVHRSRLYEIGRSVAIH